MTPEDLRRRFDALVDAPFEPPPPGSGRTMTRFAELWAVAHDDLSLARLAEAHADAVAILHEDGRTPLPGARYAVWASEAPGRRLSAELDADGWRLSGMKRFCSGLGHVTHALVTADTPDDTALFEIPVQTAGPEARIDTSGWGTEAFAATLTGTLHLDRLHLPPTAVVGGPGWYVRRPGFWHGAIGVAACWAGGAAALVSAHDQLDVRDSHRAAHAGAMRSDVWEMRAVLERAAADIDRDPLDQTRAGMARALAVRFVIERATSDVIRRFGASTGPVPRAFDAHIARRCAELQLYLLQSHAERDMEALGRHADRSLTALPTPAPI